MTRWRNERGTVFKRNPKETSEDRQRIIAEKGFQVGDTVTHYNWALVGDAETGRLRGADARKGCKIDRFTEAFMVKIKVPAPIIQRGKVVMTTWDERSVSPRNLEKE